jgi:hypothetical protein
MGLLEGRGPPRSCLYGLCGAFAYHLGLPGGDGPAPGARPAAWPYACLGLLLPELITHLPRHGFWASGAPGTAVGAPPARGYTADDLLLPAGPL